VRAREMFNGYTWQTRVLEVRPDRLPPDLDLNINNNHNNVSALGLPGPSKLATPMRTDEVEPQLPFMSHDLLSPSGSILGGAGLHTAHAGAGGRSLFVGNVSL
jgi:hypothetical protein